MEECWGVRGTVVGGIFFTEARLAGEVIGPAEVIIHRQNSNLTVVKERLAAQVTERGGNALCDFTYGQRAQKWWKIHWDEEDWYGRGTIVRMPPPA